MSIACQKNGWIFEFLVGKIFGKRWKKDLRENWERARQRKEIWIGCQTCDSFLSKYEKSEPWVVKQKRLLQRKLSFKGFSVTNKSPFSKLTYTSAIKIILLPLSML